MLQKLISAGHLRRLPPAEWFALTEEDCRVLCGKALRNPPLTFAPATPEQKNLLRSDLTLGLLPGLYASDIPHLTAADAEILLGISAERRFTHAAPYHEILKRELRDTEPAAPEQLRKIRHAEDVTAIPTMPPKTGATVILLPLPWPTPIAYSSGIAPVEDC